MISRFFKNLPPYTRTFYFLFSFFFLIWMLFLDSNDVFTQLMLRRKLNDLESQKEYYLERIQEVQQDREELLSDSELLEKFARERYMMKKPTEDLYIIVAEE